MPLNSTIPRSQTASIPKEKAEQLTLWVKPIVKAEVQRIAQQEGLSVSATGSAFLEKSLQQHIDLHYSAVLQPVIKQAIAHEMRSISTRLALSGGTRPHSVLHHCWCVETAFPRSTASSYLSLWCQLYGKPIAETRGETACLSLYWFAVLSHVMLFFCFLTLCTGV